jgi:hypothetical protein
LLKHLTFIAGLARFFHERMEPHEAVENARQVLRDRVDRREDNFLEFARRAVFENPTSPYLRLLRPKRIGFDDLQRWVNDGGVEAGLAQLQHEGIYFTIEEYKGLTDVVRGDVRFRAREEEFDNPFLSTAYEVRSGATRSAGTRVRVDFAYLAQRSPYDALLLASHDVLTSPVANWFPVFPGAPGINASLRFAIIGNPPREWFSQVDKDSLDLSWERRWGVSAMIYTSRLFGVGLASPKFVDLNNGLRVARWATEALQESEHCVIYTFASSAVRVCAAARENDLNLEGARFLVTGEPLTAQKRREIEDVGARAVPVYGISEAGVIAAGCTQPYPDSDHTHVYKDSTGIVQYQRYVPQRDAHVEALLFSTLLDDSPKVLLNVEMGDSGDVSTHACSCDFGALGFDVHLSHIRSFEKLTGEGVSFVNTDLVRIVEEALPSRFGGESTDYQLVEMEEATGITRLQLVVSPRVGDVDEGALAQAFIEELRGSKDDALWAQSGPEMWEQTGTVSVVRDYPMATKRGKILPFHLYRAEPSSNQEAGIPS